MTIRVFVGLSSPLFGPISDRHGRRAVMLSGLAMLVAVAVLIGLPSAWPAFPPA